MLVLENLGFMHPGQQPYSFDMTAEAGEVVAVTGESGSGKSTLLDLVAGFLLPTRGRVLLDDRDITGLEPERRPVSILFQSELLFYHLSAAANVALGLERGLGRSSTDARVQAALAEVGLARIGRQSAATLSGGQKQRVALARTLLRDRPILLLDEPFSALDDQSRSEMRNLVQALTRSRNWHTVLVTHNLEDVSALGARRYRLARGVLTSVLG